jgi:hypothetical protein
MFHVLLKFKGNAFDNTLKKWIRRRGRKLSIYKHQNKKYAN